MTNNSKRTMTSMIAGILTVAAYIIFVCAADTPAQEDVAAWAKLMLIFIGIGVVVQIAVAVLFRVVLALGIAAKEKRDGKTEAEIGRIVDSELKEDERDFLINLKTLRIGYTIAGVGLLAALFALAGNAPFIIALHIAVGAGAAGSLVEGCASVFFHERGVRNG